MEILQDRGWLNDSSSNDEESFQKVIFFSFSLESLERLKELAPEETRVLLIGDNMINRRSWSHWVESSKDIVHGLGVKGFVSWPWHVSAAHEEDLFVFVYTINYLWQVKVLAHVESSGYITDRPEVVLEFLDRMPEFPDLNGLINGLED